MSRICKTRRNQPGIDMKEQIRDRFAQLVAENRTDGEVTMEHLAQFMGIAKGTIYLYYKNKEELVRDAILLEIRKKIERMEREILPDMTAPDQLMLYARIMMEDFHRTRWLRAEFIRKNPLSAASPYAGKKDEILFRILRQGIRERTFRDVPVEETAAFIRCAMVGQFRHLLRTGKEIDISRALALFQDMILRALLA